MYDKLLNNREENHKHKAPITHNPNGELLAGMALSTGVKAQDGIIVEEGKRKMNPRL